MKKCFKCGLEKPRIDFYKHAAMGDGLLGKCKECTKTDTKKNREENKEHYLDYDRMRSFDDHRVEMRKKYQEDKKEDPEFIANQNERSKAWIRRNPEKRRAHIILGNAVKDGTVIKPTSCPCCNKVVKRRYLHAHHHDYSKPLDVEWKCKDCHGEEHRRYKHLIRAA